MSSKPIYKFMCNCQIDFCNKKADYMVTNKKGYMADKYHLYYFCSEHIDREFTHLQNRIKDRLEKRLLADIESGKELGW